MSSPNMQGRPAGRLIDRFRWHYAFALLFALAMPAHGQGAALRQAWPDTDFTRRGIDLADVVSGAPAKDGIPALTQPEFMSVAAESRLSDPEPVMSVHLPGQQARAYPLRYLTWHEIVNDVIGGHPVLVTFCPLCNTRMVFDPRVNGQALSFGVLGLLRHSDMIMYDRATESYR